MNARPTGDKVSQVLFFGDCLVSGSFGGALAAIPDQFPAVECFVINLECAVAESEAPRARKSYPLVASYEDFEKVLAAFRGRKVVFNQANNHSADAGLPAKEALARWCAGRGIVLVDQGKPVQVQLSCGRQLRLCACFDPGSPQAPQRLADWSLPGTNRAGHEEMAVFLPHWGEEYVFFPSPRQVATVKAAWDAGFRLVVGCHPHVVQGVGSQEGRHAYYSLGNGTLYLDCMLPGSQLGAALRCAVSGDGGIETSLLPFTVSKTGDLRFFDQAAEREFLALVEELSAWPEGAWWWQRQAAHAFFQNHLASWRKRIKQHGFWEFARMVKAFASRNYCEMAAAWVTGLGRLSRNALVAQRLEALCERKGTQPS